MPDREPVTAEHVLKLARISATVVKPAIVRYPTGAVAVHSASPFWEPGVSWTVVAIPTDFYQIINLDLTKAYPIWSEMTAEEAQIIADHLNIRDGIPSA